MKILPKLVVGVLIVSAITGYAFIGIPRMREDTARRVAKKEARLEAIESASDKDLASVLVGMPSGVLLESSRMRIWEGIPDFITVVSMRVMEDKDGRIWLIDDSGPGWTIRAVSGPWQKVD